MPIVASVIDVEFCDRTVREVNVPLSDSSQTRHPEKLQLEN